MGFGSSGCLASSIPPPKTNVTMENPPLKMYFLLNMRIFRCHVCFRGVRDLFKRFFHLVIFWDVDLLWMFSSMRNLDLFLLVIFYSHCLPQGFSTIHKVVKKSRISEPSTATGILLSTRWWQRETIWFSLWGKGPIFSGFSC